MPVSAIFRGVILCWMTIQGMPKACTGTQQLPSMPFLQGTEKGTSGLQSCMSFCHALLMSWSPEAWHA